MKVAGFTIIKNAVLYDYPVMEAIHSILDMCDAFYVGVGKSDDNTRELIEKISSPKITILDTVWDNTLRQGGKILSIETNKVFDAIPLEYDWCFYIQSDEAVHEEDLKKIKDAMLLYKDDKNVDGLLFNYKHFYGQYNYIGVGRRWYSKEIRVIRNKKSIRSYKDAQGFRLDNDRKLHVKEISASIYHYGWVKPPKAQQAKQKEFHKMWHDDEWMKKNISATDEYDYSEIDFLEKYNGTHPAIYKKRIAEAKWIFNYDKRKIKIPLLQKFLYWFEKVTGWRPGENRNYILIK